MQNGLIDIAIMNVEMEGLASLAHTVLVTEQLLLIGPASSQLQSDQSVSASFLSTCPLIMPGRPNPFRKQIESYLQSHGKKYRRTVDAETLQLCLSLVKDGLGYTVMPFCAIYDHQDIDNLKMAPIEGLHVTWSLFVNQSRRHQTSVRNTAQRLRKLIIDLVNSGDWRYANLVI
jgi:LysR family nitrogen assimilation transcriptional regulator